jgi:hypothetical protein
MPNLFDLITCARLGGRWALCRLAGVRSASSRVIHDLARGIDALESCRLPLPVPLPVRTPRLLALTVLPALMLAVLTASPTFASRTTGFETTADGRLVDVQVQVDGRTVPLYLPTDGSDRHYFQAFRGRHYALVVTNNTGRRIGVLVAVDGLNVVNGQRSSLAANEAMYVLDPWERTVIRGWRSSLQDVRQFVFVDEERSYAQRIGQANGDLGWVRVLAFNERGQRWFDSSPGRINQRELNQDEVRPYGSGEEKDGDAPQAQRRDMPGAGPEAQEGEVAPPNSTWGQTKSLYGEGRAPAPQSAVPGTGWGEKQRDPVRRVWFVPEAYATDQLVLRYEYASGLRALGIFPRQVRDRLWEREHGELGFAQPPRW